MVLRRDVLCCLYLAMKFYILVGVLLIAFTAAIKNNFEDDEDLEEDEEDDL